MQTSDWLIIGGYLLLVAMVVVLAIHVQRLERLLEDPDHFMVDRDDSNARSILGSKGYYKGEAGFTLIELMVVVLIIGILIAIGLPTFLNARDRAADRAAQASLQNGLTAANVYYTDDTTYLGFETQAPTDEPGINWVDGTGGGVPATENAVTINTATGDVVEMSILSDTGQTYCVGFDQTGGGVEHGLQDADTAACNGNAW